MKKLAHVKEKKSKSHGEEDRHHQAESNKGQLNSLFNVSNWVPNPRFGCFSRISHYMPLTRAPLCSFCGSKPFIRHQQLGYLLKMIHLGSAVIGFMFGILTATNTIRFHKANNCRSRETMKMMMMGSDNESLMEVKYTDDHLKVDLVTLVLKR